MNEGYNSLIGIVLCAVMSDKVAKYTPYEENTQIFVSKYMLYISTEVQRKNSRKSLILVSIKR